jgi:hypothetical protein
MWAVFAIPRIMSYSWPLGMIVGIVEPGGGLGGGPITSRSVLRGREVELVCGACEAVFANVRIRPLALGMAVHSLVIDTPIMPRPGYSINEEARQRLERAEAVGAADTRTRDQRDSARAVVEYLRRHGGDIVYDMSCRCRRRYVRTSPELFREINGVRGRWLTLSPGTASWPPPEDL